MHDHERSRSAGGGESLGPPVPGAGAESALGGRHTEFVIGGSGKLNLAAVLDLFSRFVVGWAVSVVNDRHLVIRALAMALKRRCPDVTPAPLRSR
jgi:transposase InsO family protein